MNCDWRRGRQGPWLSELQRWAWDWMRCRQRGLGLDEVKAGGGVGCATEMGSV